MNRKCKFYKGVKSQNRQIYVDVENEKEINEYLNRSPKHRKKFQYISTLVLQGLQTDLYKKVKINEKAGDITEIRLFPNNTNDRIYCKEMRDEEGNKHIIIMSVLHEKKKNNDLQSKEISAITKVIKYEYELER